MEKVLNWITIILIVIIFGSTLAVAIAYGTWLAFAVGLFIGTLLES